MTTLRADRYTLCNGLRSAAYHPLNHARRIDVDGCPPSPDSALNHVAGL